MLELRKQGMKGVNRMGTYLNPGNGGFERIAKSGYIDIQLTISYVSVAHAVSVNLMLLKCCVPIMTTPATLTVYLMIKKSARQNAMRITSTSTT